MDAGPQDAGGAIDAGPIADTGVQDAGSTGCTDATWEDCIYEPEAHPIAEIEGYTVEHDTLTRRFPILVRYPTDLTGPLPIVIASHGGSLDNSGHRQLQPWGETFAQAGYVVIHFANVELEAGGADAVCRLIEVPAAECTMDDFRPPVALKPFDAIALLDELPEIAIWLRGETGIELDPARIGSVGWSGGSQAGMTLGGSVRYASPSTLHSAPDARLLAAFGLSPQGPGKSGYFEEPTATSMDDVMFPVLIATGVHDIKESDPDLTGAIRRRAFENLPGGAGTQHLLYSRLPIGVGGHSSYNLGDLESDDERLRRHGLALQSAGRAFMDANLRGSSDARSYLASDAPHVLAGVALSDWESR